MCVQHCSLTYGFNVTRNAGNERVYMKTEVPLFYYITSILFQECPKVIQCMHFSKWKHRLGLSLISKTDSINWTTNLIYVIFQVNMNFARHLYTIKFATECIT